MGFKRGAALAWLGLMGMGGWSAAEAKGPLPRYGVMVYSNLCVDRQGADRGPLPYS